MSRLTYLHILQTILRPNHPEHILLTTLLQLARQQQLIQNKVSLLEVEDDVEFADIAVVFVHLLDVAVHDFEGDELVVGRIGGGDEEEGGVAAVDYFGVCRS